MRNVLSVAALVLIFVTGCAGPRTTVAPAPLAFPTPTAMPVPTVMPSVTTSAVAAVTIQPQDEMRPTAASSITPEPTAAPTLAPTAVATATPSPQASPSPSAAPTAVKSAVQRPQVAPPVALPDLGAASEFAGISQWVNSAPLTLASLRGKVVVVDFWTLGCYNCRNTLPYVTGWYQKYKDQGLVVIGVHTPEFAYERDTANVKTAIVQHQIGYPVAQDNEYATWNAYRNRYWPAAYFVDAQGRIRHIQIGEGGYEQAEQVIQQLLSEAGLVGGR
jgi:thiol-disulfide isomerase/thioredoxin